ncbi:MAG: AsmA family protein [Pseudomonadota bacterium]|nr:AsmA family protein [Pseudomonadota bacterium]
MKHITVPTWKWSKRLTMVLAIIPVLLFLAFAGAISLIDFNQYKPQIEQEVSQRTGHEFKIEGAIDVSIFPFSFSAGDMALKNSQKIVERFEQEDLLSIKQVQAELSMWELLINKRLTIKGLELIEPKLSLLHDDKGHNWQSLESLAMITEPLLEQWQRESAIATAQDIENFKQSLRFTGHQGADVSAEADAAAHTEWHFDSLIIKQGAFEYHDRRIDHHGFITNLNLLAFDVTLGQPFQVRSDFEYNNARYDQDYRFDVTANMDISEDFMKWQVIDWQGIFNIKLPEEQQVPEMRLVTEGQRFVLDLLNEQITAEKLLFQTLGSKIETSFSGRVGTTPELKGSFSIAGINAPLWGRHLGLPLPGFVDETALTSLNGQFDWHLTDQKWAFNQIDVNIDETNIQGDIWHEGMADESQYLFDISINKLNLDRYQARANDGFLEQLLIPEEKKPVESDNKLTRPVQTQIDKDATYLPLAVPVRTLKGMNANGQLKLANLTVNGLTLTEVDIELQAKQGQLQLAPFDAKLYKGKLASKLEMDVNGETPAYQWYGQLNDIEMGAFLEAGWQIKPIDGALNTHFKLHTLGSNQQVLIQNLKGEFTVNSAKGHFYGMDIEKLLAGQESTYKDKTPYHSLVLKGLIDKGIYKAKQFSVESQRFSGSGFGSVDLNKASINSTLKLRVTQPPESLKHLKGVLVPVSYKGPLEKAQWSVNLQSLINDPGNQQRLISQLKALLQ